MEASLLGVRIPIPAEAVIPVTLGIIALLVLIFAGTKLAEWKQNNPIAATRFGLVVGAVFLACSLYFLLRCVTNQIDPNNEGGEAAGGGRVGEVDVAAALAAAFLRMGGQRMVALAVGLGIGALMMAKPFIWPVITTHASEHANWSHPRDLIDPEHIMFLGPGLLAIIVGLIAGLKKPPS